MKKVILFVMMMPYVASAQVFVDFESGVLNGWIQSPPERWHIDSVQPLSGRFSLHHCYDNLTNGNDLAGIELRGLHPSEDTTSWSFTLKHGYDPSSSNNWMVFLMTDNMPSPDGGFAGVNGYAIGVNISGSDDSLRLVKFRDGVISLVCATGVNWQSAINSGSADVSITRTPSGLWRVAVSNNTGILSRSKVRNEPELFEPSFFTIVYRYSSTKDRLLWLDDISIMGSFYEDKQCPELSQYSAVGRNKIRVSFSEPVSEESMQPGNLILNDKYIPTSIKQINPLSFLLVFTDQFNNKEINTLIIKNICDMPGNCFDSIKVSFTPVWAEIGDIVITEIMADPDPVVSLPNAEYIEIVNRTNFEINLSKWKLTAGGKECIFTEMIIGARETMALCDEDDIGYFDKFGRVIGVENFPSFDNKGAIVAISDSSGNFIHGVEYSATWYNNSLKDDGGWSLEMKNTDSPFSFESNWTASISNTGGTPGLKNSAANDYQDLSFSGLLNVCPLDSSSVFVRFSEPVPCLNNYTGGISIDGQSIQSIHPVDILLRSFIAIPRNQLETKKEYTLNLDGTIKDFSGNMPWRRSFMFGITTTVTKGDLLFNELLFNPYPDDPDYIEFFNTSGYVLDASELQVVSVSADSDTSALYLLSEENRCIMPGAFFVITADISKVGQRYQASCSDFLFERSLPSMPDEEGHLILLNRSLDKIDEVFYSDDMHYSLLSGTEGISLEKMSPGYDSAIRGNWSSASGNIGWGTPGAPNSAHADTLISGQQVELSSTRITPDSDGSEDLLMINIKAQGLENVISVTVFDDMGRHIKRIASNLLSGPESNLFWDGTSDDGSVVRTGIYIVFIEMFDETGRKQRWKKVCSVIR
ncbi:MAG TPA: lamin tail domain-containing protein [Bacteroidales bacterium]|nr:lamin tail domain-containing protein [Bacteroidales bacterium]